MGDLRCMKDFIIPRLKECIEAKGIRLGTLKYLDQEFVIPALPNTGD